MKSADIEVGKSYLVKWDYGARIKAMVVKKGVERQHGYRGETRKNGVLVRAEQEHGKAGAYYRVAVGDEKTLGSRYIERLWASADDERVSDRQAKEHRAAAIRDQLSELGFGVTDSSWPETDVVVTGTGADFTLDAIERLLELSGNPR